jgi:hypothetical protein
LLLLFGYTDGIGGATASGGSRNPHTDRGYAFGWQLMLSYRTEKASAVVLQ